MLVPVVSFVDANASDMCCLSCIFEITEYLKMYSLCLILSCSLHPLLCLFVFGYFEFTCFPLLYILHLYIYVYRFVSVIVSNLVFFDSLGRQQEVPHNIHYNGTLPAADGKKFPKRFAVEDEFFVFRGGNWERVVFWYVPFVKRCIGFFSEVQVNHQFIKMPVPVG